MGAAELSPQPLQHLLVLAVRVPKGCCAPGAAWCPGTGQHPPLPAWTLGGSGVELLGPRICSTEPLCLTVMFCDSA